MLDFLATATLEDVAEHKVARKGGPRKERNPEGLAIRLFKDGSVFPSQELVDKFALEYAGRDVEHGYGFDIIDTALYPSFKVGKRIILISPVKKSAPKVDLFGSTTYEGEEAGAAPKASVLSQGSKTFGSDDLIPLLGEVYDIKFNRSAVEAKAADGDKPAVEAVEAIEDGVDSIDLVLVANPATGEPWGLQEGKDVTFLPKKVSRGKDKGQVNTIRREQPKFYALVPSSLIEKPAETTGNQPAAEETNADGVAGVPQA